MYSARAQKKGAVYKMRTRLLDRLVQIQTSAGHSKTAPSRVRLVLKTLLTHFQPQVKQYYSKTRNYPVFIFYLSGNIKHKTTV